VAGITNEFAFCYSGAPPRANGVPIVGSGPCDRDCGRSSPSRAPRSSASAPPPLRTRRASPRRRSIRARPHALQRRRRFDESASRLVRAHELSPRSRENPEEIARATRDRLDFARRTKRVKRSSDKVTARRFRPRRGHDVKDGDARIVEANGAIKITGRRAGATVTIDGSDTVRTPIAKPVRVTARNGIRIVLAKTGVERSRQTSRWPQGRDGHDLDGTLEPEVKTGTCRSDQRRRRRADT